MIIVMKSGAPRDHIDIIINKAEAEGLQTIPLFGTERTVIALLGDTRKLTPENIKAHPSVDNVLHVVTPYKLTSRDTKKEDTIIDVKGVKIGKGHFTVMAGPCAVEGEEMLIETAKNSQKHGAQIIRGGAFKPRTSPYSFQGLEEEGLKILKKARKETGMPIVTEVMEVNEVEIVAKYADILQIGTRNMHNFKLLTAVGKTKKPVLLKRGMSAKLKEWLMAAEYIMKEGNPNVILCERGIRTFSDYSRNTLDLSIVPMIKKLSHLPIIVDPSHATGVKELVVPMAKAAIAAGADGIMIETHPNPKEAVSDGDQSLTYDEFAEMMKDLKPYIKLNKLLM